MVCSKLPAKMAKLACQICLGNDDGHVADVILLTKSLKGKFIWDTALLKFANLC